MVRNQLFNDIGPSCIHPTYLHSALPCCLVCCLISEDFPDSSQYLIVLNSLLVSFSLFVLMYIGLYPHCCGKNFMYSVLYFRTNFGGHSSTESLPGMQQGPGFNSHTTE